MTATDHLGSAGHGVTASEMPDLPSTYQLRCDLIMTDRSVLQKKPMREPGSAGLRQALDGSLKTSNIIDDRTYMEAIATAVYEMPVGWERLGVA